MGLDRGCATWGLAARGCGECVWLAVGGRLVKVDLGNEKGSCEEVVMELENDVFTGLCAPDVYRWLGCGCGGSRLGLSASMWGMHMTCARKKCTRQVYASAACYN